VSRSGLPERLSSALSHLRAGFRFADVRLYINYRGLNAIIIKNRYSLPLIIKTLDRLYDLKIFTKLDLKDTYYRIRIKEGDK